MTQESWFNDFIVRSCHWNDWVFFLIFIKLSVVVRSVLFARALLTIYYYYYCHHVIVSRTFCRLCLILDPLFNIFITYCTLCAHFLLFHNFHAFSFLFFFRLQFVASVQFISQLVGNCRATVNFRIFRISMWSIIICSRMARNVKHGFGSVAKRAIGHIRIHCGVHMCIINRLKQKPKSHIAIIWICWRNAMMHTSPSTKSAAAS